MTVRRLVIMKKQFIFFVFMLLFALLFSMPGQALSRDILKQYVKKNANLYYNPADENLGGMKYWEKQIDQKRWVGENRPTPLMGDANIDGKVDAVDALFALQFSVYGNIQMYRFIFNAQVSPFYLFNRDFRAAYNQEGGLVAMTDSTEHWVYYCFYNSPFFADVTKDCVVNSKDALQILKYSVGKTQNFPVGDFTTISGSFSYYPWATEYYPEFFGDLFLEMADEEFCEKYNYYPNVTQTDS